MQALKFYVVSLIQAISTFKSRSPVSKPAEFAPPTDTTKRYLEE